MDGDLILCPHQVDLGEDGTNRKVWGSTHGYDGRSSGWGWSGSLVLCAYRRNTNLCTRHDV
jgi:hypothetical protein